MSADVVVRHRIDRTTRIRRWALRLGIVYLGAIAALMVVNVAQAYWAGSGSGIGLASTATLTPPSNVAAVSPNGSDSVTVTWDAARLSTNDGVMWYYVSRSPAGGGASTGACGTSATTLISETECQDLAVADGSYRYVVRAVLGSWTADSAPSAAVTVHLNAGAPVVTASTSPTPNSNGYNRTVPVTVQLTATDSDGVASITYSVDGGTAVTVAAPTASLQLSTEGSHTVTYSAVDTRGRQSALGSTTVSIDTAVPATPGAPVLAASSDTGVSSSDRITNERTPTFTGVAELGSTVRIYANGSLVGSSTAALDGTYSVTVGTVLSDGPQTMTVRAVDRADNISAASAGTSITVDSIAPTAPNAPALASASDSGRSSSDRITSVKAPTLTGTGPSDAVRVLLYDGGVQVGNVSASPAYTVTSSQLVDGAHSLTVRAWDTAGNGSVSSPATSVTIDTVAPAAPSAPVLTAASDSGSSSTDGVTKVVTPTVTGSNEALAIVTLYDGATQVGVQTTSSGAYTVTSSTLSEGTHTLKVTATDVAGNVGPASSTTTITIDITAPTAPSAPVLSAASDSGISSSDGNTNNTTPTFTGTATASTNVTLFDGSTSTGAPVLATSGGGYTATTAALSDGLRTLTARTDPDLAGNVGISSPTTVTIDTIAPTTPNTPALATASDSGRSNADGVTSVKTPTFTGTAASDAVGVVMSAGAVQLGSATPAPGYTVTSSQLADGAYAVTVRVSDRAGNVSASSAPRAVTIDTVAPAAPSAPVLSAASDSGSSSTDRITNVVTPTLVGTNEDSAIVTLFDGAAQVGVQTTSSGAYAVSSSTLSEGSHALKATATDVAGNVGVASATTTITIDTTPDLAAPSLPVLSGASDSGVSSSDRITSDTTPTFTGTAANNINVTLFDGETPVTGAARANGGSWNLTASALGDGTHVLTARTDPDPAGNAGISPSVTVTIDTTAPTLAITVVSQAAASFRFTFNEAVAGFTVSDILLSGAASPTSAAISGGGPAYDVQAAGMDRTGSAILSLGAGQVTDLAGNANVGQASATASYVDSAAPAVAITRFVSAPGQAATVEGTVGTSPGDPGTVTVVLCTTQGAGCGQSNTVATLTATATSGTWSVTSGALGSQGQLYARAFATDLSGNQGVSGPAGSVTINAVGSPVSTPTRALATDGRRAAYAGGRSLRDEIWRLEDGVVRRGERGRRGRTSRKGPL